MIVAAIASMVLYVATRIVAPYLSFYLQDLGVRDADDLPLWSGLISSAPFLTSALAAPLWGRLADRYGHKLMIIRGGFGIAAGMLLTSQATSAETLFCYQLISGLLLGFNPALVALLAHGSPRHRLQYVMGTLRAGIVIGMMIGSLAGGWIVIKKLEIPTIYQLGALAITLVTFLALFTLREPPRPHPTQAEGFFTRNRRLLRIPGVPSLIWIEFLFQAAIFGSSAALLPILVRRIATPEVDVIWWISLERLAYSCMAAFAPLAGKIGDRYGSIKLLHYALIGTALLSLARALASSVTELLCYQLLLGAAVAGFHPALHALMAKQVHPAHLGSAYGLQSSACTLGFFVSGTLLGPLSKWIGGTPGIRWALCFAGLWVVCAWLLLLVASCALRTDKTLQPATPSP